MAINTVAPAEHGTGSEVRIVARAGEEPARNRLDGSFIGFSSADEQCCMPTGFDHIEPALLINPQATANTLIAAAMSRVNRLEQQLDAIRLVEGIGEEDDTLFKILNPMHAIADEAQQLLEQAQRRTLPGKE